MDNFAAQLYLQVPSHGFNGDNTDTGFSHNPRSGNSLSSACTACTAQMMSRSPKPIFSSKSCPQQDHARMRLPRPPRRLAWQMFSASCNRQSPLEFRIDDRVPRGQASGEAANHSRVRQQGAISGLEAGRQGETIPGPSWQFSQLACMPWPSGCGIRPQKLSHVALPPSKPEATNAGNSMTVSRIVGASSD